jgi:hypothetical protein
MEKTSGQKTVSPFNNSLGVSCNLKIFYLYYGGNLGDSSMISIPTVRYRNKNMITMHYTNIYRYIYIILLLLSFIVKYYNNIIHYAIMLHRTRIMYFILYSMRCTIHIHYILTEVKKPSGSL